MGLIDIQFLIEHQKLIVSLINSYDDVRKKFAIIYDIENIFLFEDENIPECYNIDFDDENIPECYNIILLEVYNDIDKYHNCIYECLNDVERILKLNKINKKIKLKNV